MDMRVYLNVVLLWNNRSSFQNKKILLKPVSPILQITHNIFNLKPLVWFTL